MTERAMRVSFDTSAGSAAKPSEDFVAVSINTVAVLDGLTAPPQLGTGCVHGTPWYVAHLGSELLATATTAVQEPLTVILSNAIKRVADAHADTCDLAHAGTPSSSVALLRAGDETVDYLVLFDSVILLDGPPGIDVVTDHRVDTVARQEHLATLEHPVGTPEHSERVSRLVAAQRPYRNRPGGYWVASAAPSAAYQAVTGSVPRERVRRAAVLTDGASCLVDRYGLTGWPQLLRMLDEDGPGELIARVRAAEDADPTGSRWPRYKRSDDATVAYCRLD